MTLKLNDKEIQEAISDYILAQGADTEGKKVVITLIAGRGENGNSATVEIGPIEEEKTPEKKTRKKRTPKVEVTEEIKPKLLGAAVVTDTLEAVKEEMVNTPEEIPAAVEEKPSETAPETAVVEAKATVKAPAKGKSLFAPK